MIHWALLELGMPFQRHDMGGAFGGLDTPEFRALNPAGKIPVIVDDDQAVFESGAILRYLAARCGDETFWPRDPMSRAQIDKWMEWARHDIAEAFTVPIFWRVVRTPEAQRDPHAIEAAVEAFETSLAIAEPRLTRHAWLTGRDFTPADIVFGHVLWRYFDIGVERKPGPAVTRYYEDLTENPCYREAVMVSYDDLRGEMNG